MNTKKVIKEVIEKQGITYKHIEDHLGVSHGYLSRVLNQNVGRKFNERYEKRIFQYFRDYVRGGRAIYRAYMEARK